jgi:Holliday junction DNA helicase RuvA
MFNSIRGIVTDKLPDAVYVLSGGIEWDIAMPGLDIAALPATGEEARVFTWLYLREDAVRLIGFSDVRRRETFLELLKVEGIGVKGALKIMGGISRDDLLAALENEDVGRLEAVPGLGKKTALRMILSLKGKFVRETESAASPHQELVSALVDMGYDRKAALDALSRAAAELPAAPPADRETLLFRKAILHLPRP